jgi:hypothetical protein
VWPVILLFSAYWITDFRLRRYTWPQVFSTLCVALVVLVPLALLTPGWLWKTALMAYMTFPWWLAPLLATRYPAVQAATRPRPWDPEDPEGVWPELPRMVEHAAAAVEREGVTRIGLYREDTSEKMTTLTAMLESADGKEAVGVMGATHLIQPGTEAEVRHTQLNTTVSMAFTDGRRLAVTNTPWAPLRAPGSIVENFPSVDDPARLLRIARAYQARRYPEALLAPVRGGAPLLEFWAERHAANMRAQGERGLYRRQANGDWYPTLRGAVVMGWGLLFPFRQMGNLRRRMRERRILRELGMEDAAGASFPRPRTPHPFDVQLVAAVVIGLLLIVLD